MAIDRECGWRGILGFPRPPEIWCCGEKAIEGDFAIMFCENETIGYAGFTCVNPEKICSFQKEQA